jgi:hypothetical protein
MVSHKIGPTGCRGAHRGHMGARTVPRRREPPRSHLQETSGADGDEDQDVILIRVVLTNLRGWPRGTPL